MRSSFVLAVVWFSLIGVASAQYAEPRSASVVRPAGYGWRNHVVVPDGPCGHPVPVRTDCYDNCCACCGLRPICLLHRVGRMLDCLLPCNACCGLFGGPLVGGGCCGGGPIGCATPAGHGLPGIYGQPQYREPLPPLPVPTPSPATEVRRVPQRLPSAPEARTAVAPAYAASPWKLSHGPTQPTAAEPRELRSGSQRPTSAAGPSATPQRPAGESVLRRASAEEAVAPELLRVEPAKAMPIVRSQSPPADDGYGPIPHNPLRK